MLLWLIRVLRLERLDGIFVRWRARRRRVFLMLLGWLSIVGTVMGLVLGLIVLGLVWRMNADLPDYEHLTNYEPAVMTRIYAADGTLLAEYAKQHRLFVPYQEVPPLLIAAFVAAEDKSYWQHPGVDLSGIARAMVMNVPRLLDGRRLIGGSTITQQVARNFLLSQRVKLERKIKEALLALRIERVLSKEKIMELYVNEIYFGLSSYGVASAALNYFGKALSELTLSEMAYLAALPKGPNNYHPVREYDRAVARRNYVLRRMQEEGYLTDEQRRIAAAQEIPVPPQRARADKRWAYFSEDVRRTTKKLFGKKPLYQGGLTIRSTLNTELQKATYDALRDGLSAYDRRHGWRGPIRKLPENSYWPAILNKMNPPRDIDPWRLAIVLKVERGGVEIGLRPDRADFQQSRRSAGNESLNTQKGFIPLNEMQWAREQYADNTLGPRVKHPKQVLERGDVIYVEPLAKRPSPDPRMGMNLYSLRQLPRINGGIIAMDPHSGRVLAMTGGFSFAISEFNRATQAWRQPGSSIKPFVYAAALDQGFTPISRVMDAPFVSERGEEFLWKPSNYSRKFGGLTLLRRGLEQSRNLMTVHLTNEIGLGPVMDYAKRFGLATDIRPELSLALGSEETTLMRLTAAYGILANGGHRIEPFTIERIQDRLGRTIYRHDRRRCQNCSADTWRNQKPPQLADTRGRIISAPTAYQIVSMMQGVVKRGTGWRAKVKGITLAGKTGTTNKERDAWFVGFSPHLVVGIYVGFDQPQPLGKNETGGQVAAPIFSQFMARAKNARSSEPFRVPPGITLVRIDRKTGKLANVNDGKVIWEAFKIGTEPGSVGARLGRQDPAFSSDAENNSMTGTGGLY